MMVVFDLAAGAQCYEHRTAIAIELGSAHQVVKEVPHSQCDAQGPNPGLHFGQFEQQGWRGTMQGKGDAQAADQRCNRYAERQISREIDSPPMQWPDGCGEKQ
jgi:hypothetical protein